MTGSHFGSKVAIRIVIFLTLNLGLAFLTYAGALHWKSLVPLFWKWLGAQSIYVVIAGAYLQPIIFAGFLISTIGPCWRRMGTLGFPSYWGLFLPLLFLADATSMMTLGPAYGLVFASGTPRLLSPPLFGLLVVMLVIAMSMARPPSPREAVGLKRFGIAGKIAAALGIAVLALALSRLAVSWLPFVAAKFGGMSLFSLLKIGAVVSAPLPWVGALFAASVTWLVVLSRKNAADDGGKVSAGLSAHTPG